MTQVPRPNSAAARDVRSQLHPYTNPLALEADGPVIVTRGDGVWVEDEAGERYIEGLAGLWCTALGFSAEERLARAAYDQMRALSFYHPFGQKAHVPGIDLAEKLLAMAPVPMSKVLFSTSGSEANDTAIKLIRFYNNALGRPEKKKIISRIKGYHGVTLATASLTGLPNNHRDFDLPLPGILHTTCPHHYHGAVEGESPEAFATRCAEDLDALIEAEGPETVAAFFAEPVMGAGGVLVPPPTYFEKIQAVLKKHDVLLVADEVICGFGRTGNVWGSQTFGLQPDLLTCAKQLSSGYMPVSALMLSEAVYQPIRDNAGRIGILGHGYTYGGHPVACAVANEVLTIYEERELFAHAATVGPHMQARLRTLADHPLVDEVRGVGLIAGVEIARDKAKRQPFEPAQGVGAALGRHLHRRGVITRVIGDTIAFSPPLIITDEEVDAMVERVALALDDTLAWCRAEGLV
ncbi:aspartate aminotransferase family protein [Roseospira marina]|uniref:Aspartate aminotransferase family protein n=1 Tax=Roseospira marina TaxID=140057 RepID=A0A5M6IA76_9PROT|nr:aspartate aminotransferase family protein [Roseospira marina]KAA5604847.1 aspartate aminotransferase family protein [Roseospira marina]MBB4315180.1 4-aminobutyrate--pyruvate transaminase [Roseospira marina]MBB5088180.1 4-aminobutyrate--pyruvate transaminase [Roseospira marina]